MRKEYIKLRGVVPAALTAWDSKGEIDEEKTKRYLQFLIGKGINGLFCGGSFGEVGLMTLDQRRKIINIAVEATKGKLPVIVGTWHNSTKIAIELSKYAEDAGADIVMVSLPHYPKPTQVGLYEHYKAISKAINIPIFIYSWFGQYGIEIEMETLVRLAQDGYIQGIKYSTPDVGKIAEIVRLTEGKITVMPGVEILLLTALLLGADGCLGATLELVPEETVKVYNLFNEGKITEAAKQQAKIMPLFNALTHNDTRDDVPLMKEGLKMLGQDLGESPLPATKVPPDVKEKLRQELSKLGKL